MHLFAELAGALFAAYRKERSAAATASMERNELKQEVGMLPAGHYSPYTFTCFVLI